MLSQMGGAACPHRFTLSPAYSVGLTRWGDSGFAVLIDVDFENRRVYVRGRRLHHGLVGAIAVAAGLVAAVHDRRDARVWVRDFINRG